MSGPQDPNVTYVDAVKLITDHNGYLVLGTGGCGLLIFSPGHGLVADQMKYAEILEPDGSGEVVVRACHCVGDFDDLVFSDKSIKMETFTVGRRQKHGFQIGMAYYDGEWYTDGKPRPVPDSEKW